MYSTRGRGKVEVVFPPTASYKLGTKEERAKQVGFLTNTVHMYYWEFMENNLL